MLVPREEDSIHHWVEEGEWCWHLQVVDSRLEERVKELGRRDSCYQQTALIHF